MYGLTKEEYKLLKSLNTPRKIQDYLDKLSINFEEHGETCLSPRMVIKFKTAHCFEGSVFAAAALRVNGHKPLVVSLETAADDQDHLITVFKQHGHWGAISKTNHAVLRYREPVYKSIRELVMSFFHEYFGVNDGKKNLRGYSRPIDLSKFDYCNWMSSDKELWNIYDYSFKVPHIKIMKRSQIATLRKANDIEIKAGQMIEWKEPKSVSK